MSLAYALCKVSPTYFQNNPRDAEIALRSIKTVDEITRIIIRYDFKIAAARLIGAYQFLQDNETAAEIKNDLETVGIIISPTNPFQNETPFLTMSRLKSPYAGRIRAMWAEGRDAVIKYFPKPYGLPKKTDQYMQRSSMNFINMMLITRSPLKVIKLQWNSLIV